MSTITVTGIDAVYYLTQDHERATAFYRDVFGLPVAMHHEGSLTEFVLPGGEAFGLYHAGEFHPSGGVMFAVPDMNEALAALKVANVKLEGDGEVTDTPVCLMAFGQDTEGNSFILHQAKK